MQRVEEKAAHRGPDKGAHRAGGEEHGRHEAVRGDVIAKAPPANRVIEGVHEGADQLRRHAEADEDEGEHDEGQRGRQRQPGQRPEQVQADDAKGRARGDQQLRVDAPLAEGAPQRRAEGVGRSVDDEDEAGEEGRETVEMEKMSFERSLLNR